MKNRPRKKPSVLSSPLLERTLSKGEKKRLSVLEAAIKITSHLGVESLTYEMIGKKTGLSRSLIVYYFPTRDEIVESAIYLIAETAQKMTVEHLQTAHTPKLALAAVVEGAFAWANNFPDHVKVMSLFYYYCSYQANFRKLHTEIRAAGNHRLQAIIAQLSPKLNKEALCALASAVQCQITGQLHESFATNATKDLKAYERATLAQVESLVSAYA